MGNAYHQLTYDERIEIYALKKAGNSARQIAEELGRSPSTISREIARNSGARNYRPRQAQSRYLQRRRPPKHYKFTPSVRAYVEECLRFDLSPEQISATMGREIGVSISHEWIYQYIFADRARGGKLYKHLRVCGRKQRRKRYGSYDRRGIISNRRPMSERPAVAERRGRVGDFEVDLVCGKHRRGYIVTIVDRRSRFLVMGHVKRKKARAVSNEIIRILRPYRDITHTLTFDNGKEFAEHERIAKKLGCECYFARPYTSSDRGTNENTNGLIRQYFPKGTYLGDVGRAKLKWAEQRLNYRPRKVLNYNTPIEAFKT